jgi:hypothetical protein
LRRQRLDVDLEANGQCCRRIDDRQDLMHPQDVRPQLLIAERIESEDRLPFAMSDAVGLSTLDVLVRQNCAGGLRYGEGDRKHEYD